ncbi:X-Pro aminopeptidase [Sphingorhabdus lutea]|uniref:X-Pro aminopeptidase n=1 Tax=Sphingorhabdus lutea TaxID=1913578 RepID=A0A1L3JEE5_9SPHN|nr:aminopeptidase P family protein [Sphingorhabdus lutea]APG63500.1 X-Pro aminopeptidase [Sphingorhabdus lutea]
MQTHEARLSALREELKRRGISGFIIPICDEHMSEYVGEYAQRLGWLTGFGGSAGSAIVMINKAAIFTDGRYTVQVRDQVDGKLFDYVAVHEVSMIKWIAKNAQAGEKIGYDAWLHTNAWVKQAEAAAAKAGASMVAVDMNPIDAIWADQPARSDAKLQVHENIYSGKDSEEKRAEMAAYLTAKGADGAVIAALDSVAWIFNIRGEDVSNTPVPLAFTLLNNDGSATLFVAPEKITPEVQRHLGNQVSIRGYDELAQQLGQLSGKVIAVDPERSVAAIEQALIAGGAKIMPLRDPSILPKAVKNPVEQQGARNAHIRDGAAVTRFLKWCTQELVKGGQDELSAAAKLREFRDATGVLKDISFRTISAAGPHGALCHYSVDEDTNLAIEEGQLYLVDSGGQYLDGTTDITRVIAVGTPSAEMVKRYTQVLKGHIALAMARFPKGTSGAQLDVLARQYLWADGVDYAHGTGHGVGSYLAVHEGPQRISKAAGPQAGTDEPLQVGMILSNEPGYYKEGGFGIRIENLVLVKNADIEGAEGAYMEFENLTWAPLEPCLIDADMLTKAERDWVNEYHAKTYALIGPQLEDTDRKWLADMCRAI